MAYLGVPSKLRSNLTPLTAHAPLLLLEASHPPPPLLHTPCSMIFAPCCPVLSPVGAHTIPPISYHFNNVPSARCPAICYFISLLPLPKRHLMSWDPMLSSSRAPDLDCPPAPPWPFHVKGFRTNRACVLAHGPFGTWLPCCYPAVGHLFRFTHAFIFGAEPRISSAHNRWAPVLMLGPGDTRMTGTVRHLSQPVRCVPLNCVCVIMCHCGAGSVVLHALL